MQQINENKCILWTQTFTTNKQSERLELFYRLTLKQKDADNLELTIIDSFTTNCQLGIMRIRMAREASDVGQFYDRVWFICAKRLRK